MNFSCKGGKKVEQAKGKSVKGETSEKAKAKAIVPADEDDSDNDSDDDSSDGVDSDDSDEVPRLLSTMRSLHRQLGHTLIMKCLLFIYLFTDCRTCLEAMTVMTMTTAMRAMKRLLPLSRY